MFRRRDNRQLDFFDLPAAIDQPIEQTKRKSKQTTRSLKVYETTDTWYLGQKGAKSRPSIRLQGQWLNAAGFSANTRVTVHVDRGRLVIVPEK